MPDVSDGGMEAANHIAMCVSMQQSCMIYLPCTPEPKVQFYKKRTKINKEIKINKNKNK